MPRSVVMAMTSSARCVIQIGIELNDGQMAQVDLEDVLRFARTHCTGIYERVMCEAKPLR